MAAAAPIAAVAGPVLSNLLAPKPNAYTNTAAPQGVMEDYLAKLKSEFGREQGQASQGVQLPDATVSSSPTMTGGVLPFPIGDLNPGLGGGNVLATGGFGKNAQGANNNGSDPGPVLNFPPPPNTSPSPGGSAPRPIGPLGGGVPPLPGGPNVSRPSLSPQTGSSNEDAQAALRALGVKMGF